MIQYFRGKNKKDIEMASETIISSMDFTNKNLNTGSKNQVINITKQQLAEENFDNYIEKRK